MNIMSVLTNDERSECTLEISTPVSATMYNLLPHWRLVARWSKGYLGTTPVIINVDLQCLVEEPGEIG